MFSKQIQTLEGVLALVWEEGTRTLSEDAHLQALRMSEEDVEFAIGFGEGIGRVYSHLEDPEKERVMSYVNDGDAGLSRGLGMGFGLVFSYFEEDVKKDILDRIPHNTQSIIGSWGRTCNAYFLYIRSIGLPDI